MRIKLLIALLLTLLVIASVAHAQEATVEPAPEATSVGAEIAPVEETPTEEAEIVTEGEAVEAEAEAADEGEAEASAETPAGSALLMLLLGLGAVIVVGGVTMLRGNSQPPQS